LYRLSRNFIRGENGFLHGSSNLLPWIGAEGAFDVVYLSQRDIPSRVGGINLLSALLTMPKDLSH
jgi:hypothetical protein